MGNIGRMLIAIPAMALNAWAQTPEPARYEVKATSVWGVVRGHVTEREKSFKVSIASDAPLEGWRLTKGTDPKPLAQGRLQCVFRFEVEHQRVLEPGLQMVLLVVSGPETHPVPLRLFRDAAVMGATTTLERELEFQEEPQRPYHASVRDLYERAAEAYRLKDLKTSRELLGRALELDPGNSQALKLKGRVEREEAQGRNARRIDLARREWEQGRAEFALKEIRVILREDPGCRSALDLRKRIESSEEGRRTREIEKALESAVQAERSGDPLEAESRYRRVMELDPENQEAVLGLRRVTAAPPKREKKAKAPEEMSPDRVEKADRAYNLGLDCYRRGDLDGARKFWEETISYQPGHFQAKRNLARLDARKRD